MRGSYSAGCVVRVARIVAVDVTIVEIHVVIVRTIRCHRPIVVVGRPTARVCIYCLTRSVAFLLTSLEYP